MKFSDIKKTDLSFSEADAYLELYENELDEIYASDSPDGGNKGWVWRQLFGKPKEVSPLLLYLTEKLINLESEVDSYKKVARRNSNEKIKLESVVKNVRANNQRLDAQNKQMRGRLDDETARCLMESISYLATICKNNNLPFDVNSLPHYEKLDAHRISYLKSLMKIDCR